ncbi:unnamed protein product [Rotaria socialis]|uniref:Fucosyltransferase n=1 Tax=Rotaria socialis TaxID=392032 RepID=A0A817WUJ6_9BILA|nr:unnamed protein product [Rotaria socialis]
MRLITRHQLPSIHPRRSFVSLLFTISIFVSIGIILRAANQDTQSTAIINEPIVTKQKEVKLSENKTILNQKIAPVQKENAWPLDAQGRSLKTNFLVLDWTGFFGGGATEGERVLCSSSNTTFVWTRQHNRIEETDFIIAHDGGAGGSIPFDHLHLNKDQQQYTMAFVMESEVHSTTGNAWARFNFIMTYNLDDSYPEPATYFDMNLYLDDLLRPPSVSFEDKEKQADAVWIISNCNAQNGREGFIQRLMQEIKIDSFGSCFK